MKCIFYETDNSTTEENRNIPWCSNETLSFLFVSKGQRSQRIHLGQ